MNNGNLMINLPLAALPPGRGGLSAGVRLNYESKLWETVSGTLNDISPNGDPITWNVKYLGLIVGNGWQYQFQYQLGGINRSNGYTDETSPGCPYPEASYNLKVEMSFPDGSRHLFRPVGFNDLLNDGFFNVTPDGHGWTCVGAPRGGSALYTTITTQNMTYYSTDGTYLRLEVDHNTGGWTLYFPDGGRVINSSTEQLIKDRNDNYVSIQNTTYNSHQAKRIVDQFNREVILEFDPATNQDYVHQWGFNHEELVWTVKWKESSISKNYLLSDDPTFTFPPQNINTTARVVDQILLPAQAGALAYTFKYNTYPDNPPAGGEGWGELSSVSLPSGARADYHYTLDGQDNIYADTVVDNAATRKDLTYLQEYDGTATPVTETWQYGNGTMITPAGGRHAEYFRTFSKYARVPDRWDDGISLRSDYPDGRRVERYWQPNTPFGAKPINPYVKVEYTSLPDATGNLTLTAIKAFDYDKNGNVITTTEYDWVPFSQILRASDGNPTGDIPAGAQVKRVTNNTYYNPTPIATNTTEDNPNVYHKLTSPRLRNAVATSEVSDGAQAQARTEYTYDNPALTGNLTEQRNWDSFKDGIYRPYSAPLTSTNSISVSYQYDPYGNVTLKTDPNNHQTQFFYGAVGAFADLYPTQVKSAYGTSVEQTTTQEYDFWTGLVIRVTAPNGVASATTYDAFGRPTLTKAAEGRVEEVRTETDYADSLRRVIVRQEMCRAGDQGCTATTKLVGVTHYDQLGRVRLSRQLEDANTQSETDETAGIKVQTRYKYTNPCAPDNTPQCLAANAANLASYQLVSNPYRAASSSAANGEQPMGWTLSKADKGGHTVEVRSFAGSGLPAPWEVSGNANTNTTGAITTFYDGIFTTVTDQQSKVRRSMIDGLGRLARVDEPDANSGLGATATPTQPTSYSYDGLSNLTQVNQGQQSRAFQYSSLARLLAATNPENGTVSYEYDNNGNLKKKLDPRVLTTGPNSGQRLTITYEYDELNRVKTRTYNDLLQPGGSSVTPAVNYTYDATDVPFSKGRLTSVAAAGVSTTNYGAYDALGRVKQSTQATAGVTYTFSDYSYDRAGSLLSETYPSGRVIKTEYDSAGRLAGAKDQAATGYYAGAAPADPNRIEYAAHGAVSKLRLGNLLWEHTNYNSRLQPIQIGLGTLGNDSSKLQLDYTYGVLVNSMLDPAQNNGNVQSQTITLPSRALVQTYTYDGLNRLKSAAESGGLTQTFDYDSYGNRAVVSGYVFDGLVPRALSDYNAATNRLSNREYDGAGSITRDGISQGHTYAYDAESRQTQYDSGAATYVYDGDGRRVKKVVGLTNTIFVYDAAGRLAAEYTDAAQIGAGGTSYLTDDQLGTPRVVTGTSQEVKARHDYLPFGEEIGAGVGGRTTQQGYSQPDGVRQRFTSKERDDETGLDYFGERYYVSTMGRFTSVDPLGASARLSNPQSMNRYTFVLNNPLRYVDPDGLKEKDPWNQLTDEERKALAAKLTTVKDANKISTKELKAAGQKFNTLVTVKGDAQATADRVATAQNFVANFNQGGPASQNAVYQQINSIEAIGRSAVEVTVQDKDQFLTALSNAGYAVNSADEYVANAYAQITKGSADHPFDTARAPTIYYSDPELHFANDRSNDPNFGPNYFFAHWDPTSVNCDFGCGPIGRATSGREHSKGPASPAQVREYLKRVGNAPVRD